MSNKRYTDEFKQEAVRHVTEHQLSIADGIAIREPVEYATRALFDLIDEVVEVNDQTILHAMHLLQEKIGVIVEPAGAAGVAAIINKPDYVKGRTVGTVLCGGNVTPAQFSEWFASR